MYSKLEISLEKTSTQESNRVKNGVVEGGYVINTQDLVLNTIL